MRSMISAPAWDLPAREAGRSHLIGMNGRLRYRRSDPCIRPERGAREAR